jgi:hypothetical protein
MPSSSTENTPCSMSVTCTMEQSEENENIEETESLNTNPLSVIPSSNASILTYN